MNRFKTVPLPKSRGGPNKTLLSVILFWRKNASLQNLYFGLRQKVKENTGGRARGCCGIWDVVWSGRDLILKKKNASLQNPYISGIPPFFTPPPLAGFQNLPRGGGQCSGSRYYIILIAKMIDFFLKTPIIIKFSPAAPIITKFKISINLRIC